MRYTNAIVRDRTKALRRVINAVSIMSEIEVSKEAKLRLPGLDGGTPNEYRMFIIKDELEKQFPIDFL